MMLIDNLENLFEIILTIIENLKEYYRDSFKVCKCDFDIYKNFIYIFDELLNIKMILSCLSKSIWFEYCN